MHVRMVIGFIFIKTHPRTEVQTYRTLMKLEEIKELIPLFGEFDLIAKIEGRDLPEISRIVLEKIRTIPGVEETMTIPGVEI